MDPEGPSPNAAPSLSPSSGTMKLKDDPVFAKYFKVRLHFYTWAWIQAAVLEPPSPSGPTSVQMMAMHLPKPAVVMKMEAEGVEPKVVLAEGVFDKAQGTGRLTTIHVVRCWIWTPRAPLRTQPLRHPAAL